MANRDIRRVINSKQDSLESTGNLSINSMSDGQISISKSSNELLSINKKKYGRLYKGYLSSSGNQIVDKNLTVRGNLNVKGHIVGSSFKIIAHNMEDDIGTAEVFLPWFGVLESSDLTGTSSSLLVPYSMTLKKIMFRPSAISTGSYDLVVRLKKMDDGDATTDTVATATWDVSESEFDNLSANTLISVNRSHFDNNPKFEIGDNCGVSIQASGDYGSSIKWKITSVWEVEIVL
tara:strand:+ start:80 stop:781 length:702 start_codon:yes stop_codon:yes gene_type:complete